MGGGSRGRGFGDGAGLGGGDADVHAAVNFAVEGAAVFGGVAEAEGVVIVDDFFAGEFQVDRVGAEEAAHVDFGQFDIKLVILVFVQVVAADFGGLGGFTDGNAFALTGFFEAFADGLHRVGLGKTNRKGKADFKGRPSL